MYRDDDALSPYAHAPNRRDGEDPDVHPDGLDRDDLDRDDTLIRGGAGPIAAVLLMALLALLALQLAGVR